MKRHKVVYRPSAVADLEGIHDWVAETSHDPVTAQRFIDRLMTACERIGDRPHAGRQRDDLWPGLLTMPFEKRAVIAYLVVDDIVVIINVFNGGRDYEALYRGDVPDDGP